MGLQNKIYGLAFSTVGIVQVHYDNEPKFELFDGGVLYRLNPETLSEYGIEANFYEDFIEQLSALGTLEDIQALVGLEPRSGYQRGIVLKHSKRPDILAAVTVICAPRTGFNPSVYQNRNMDIMLDCYIDVDGVGPSDAEDRSQENEMNIVGALINSKGISESVKVPMEESDLLDEDMGNPDKEAQGFYESLLTEEVDKEMEKEFIQGSNGFPKEFLKFAKPGKMLFVHKHGNLDTVLSGGGVMGRPVIEKFLGKKDVIVAKGSKGLKEGHIFLGVVGLKGGVANAYIEQIDGDMVYISGISSHLEQ